MLNNSSSPPTGALVHHSPWEINRRVITALFLREMLTRYGRNNIGFLWILVQPMIFTLLVVGLRSATASIYQGKIPMVAFAITGWPALMLWRNMPSRTIGALRSNRSLLHHRQVKILDVYIARLLLEFMATTTSLVLVSLILGAMGWLTPPENILKVAGGWILLAWFGVGLALIIGSLSEKSDLVVQFWRPLSYLLMPMAGVAFVVDALPRYFQNVVLWFPALNAVEFLRDGWFGSLFRARYDLEYLIASDLFLLLIGLALARQVGLGSDEE